MVLIQNGGKQLREPGSATTLHKTKISTKTSNSFKQLGN
jgi:hypothetical protein